MATWKLAPDTGQVSGSHTDMPLLLVPSDTEIGAITLAEAQSSRFYTDNTLVTEVAREVAGADELHFKNSTFSSASEPVIDFDGVRSDYAVGATYGRNAVWSDYEFVSHDGGGNDSSGNVTPSVEGGLTIGGSTSPTGASTDFDGSNDRINLGDLDFTNLTAQAWVDPDIDSTNMYIVNKYIGAPTSGRSWILRYDDANWELAVITSSISFQANEYAQGSIASAGFVNVVGVFDDTANESYLYTDGVLRNTISVGDINQSNTDVYIGSREGTTDFWDGKIGEIRLKDGTTSTNWISTEHNNQSDNGAFWVATEEVVSELVFIPKVAMIA